MSFEDWQGVDFDYDYGEFTIIMNNGDTRTYDFDDETDLLMTILDGAERGDIDINEIGDDEDWKEWIEEVEEEEANIVYRSY